MIDIPETRYAHNGPVNLAYQVVGDGPIDVLLLEGAFSHLDYLWQYAPLVRVIERFTAFSRYVMYDKRGSGLSDRTVEPPTIVESISDAVAVLDAVGVERAHLFGHGDGGSAALALAAAHPDRVAKVAVYGAVCGGIASEDFPWAPDPDEAEAIPKGLLEVAAPTHADDPIFTRWFTRINRAGVSPAGAAAWYRNLLDLDIRPILGDVAAPVLVINRPEAQAAVPGQSRYLADHLPDARHVELPGEDFLCWVGDTDALLDEVEEFFTGTRPTRTPTRALATVMFTDIVDSTAQAADLGDEAWRALLARHDEFTRQHVKDHDGRVVKSTGDGALATFDDPENAIAAAQDLIADLAGAGLDLRVGIHFGKIEITGDDVAGIAVHLAARISSLAGPGEVYVSSTVGDLLLGSGTEFDDRGTHELKGIPGNWDILAVIDD